MRASGLTARVVGSNPPADFVARCRAAGIPVDADVPSLQPHYARALAVVMPLRVGGGTRLKVVEAFAAGVPVVATTLAVEGIAAQPGTHYLAGDTPAGMAAAIAGLAAAGGGGAAIAAAARRLVEEKYDWSHSAAALEEALLRAVAR